jgi:mannose-1-phosphate guanylyltransferase
MLLKKRIKFMKHWRLLLIMCGAFAGSMQSTVASDKTEHRYCVILAGGNGERLWPFSRNSLPKQLLPVGCQQTLLEQAINRVTGLVERDRIWISTTQHHAPRISESVGSNVGTILPEPASRNTAPAILLCCLKIYEQDPQAIIAFLPADPYIPANSSFPEFLEHAFDYAGKHDRIALFGLRPRYPATGYGYIEFDPQENPQHNALYQVKKFREKPSLEVAQEYVAAGNMLWNASIFCGHVQVFLQEFKDHAPQIYEGVDAYINHHGRYEDVVSDSIDYAVMEKSSRISVLPVDFPWCDVGNIEIFLSLKNSALASEPLITIDAKNNLVDVPNKLVALIGVDDLCVVDTGDALLVVKRQEAEKVKYVVKKLKDMQAHEYL